MTRLSGCASHIDHSTHCDRSKHCRWRLNVALFVAGLFAFGFWAPFGASSALAQFTPQLQTAAYPSEDYYTGLQIYRTGDLSSAIRAFDSARRRTRRDINGHWIDAIPVYAMLAECHWHAGDLQATRENLDQVFAIVKRRRGWFGRVEWGETLQANAARQRVIGLWPKATEVNVVPTARKMKLSSGEVLTEARIARGGPIEARNILTIDVIEVMRGLAVASYRRRMLMGPLADQDPLIVDALESTKFPAGLQVEIARTLIGAVRATERFANLEDKQAVDGVTKRSMFNRGAHPLSAITLLTGASAIATAEKTDPAVALAATAVNVAAALEQYEYVGEAMQLAAGCASRVQAETVRASAEVAALALVRKSRLASLHCLIAGADAGITAGNLASAATMLNQALTLLKRRDVLQPRLNAYAAYQTARLAAAGGGTIGVVAASDVDNALDSMNEFAFRRRDRNRKLISMPRLYQMEVIIGALGKQLGGQSSDSLLQKYCEEPPLVTWRRDPVDALTSVISDRTRAFAARLQIAASANNGIDTLARTNDLLNHRFSRRLALGGRVTQVRSLVRSDEKLIGKEASNFRNNGPQSIKDLRKAASANPPADKEQLLADANKMESQATAIALSRVKLPQTMLPTLNPKTSVSRLPPRTGLLTFISVGNQAIATLAADGKVKSWPVSGVSRVPGEIGKLIRGIGVGKIRGKRLPESPQWRADAEKLRRKLFPENTLSAEDFDRLVIVPDGSLWYLPFELLPTGGEDSPLMGDKMEIRYAATPGLAFSPTADPAVSRVVGIASDKFFAPRDPELNESITQRIADSATESIRIPQKLNAPSSLLADSIGHLLVASAISSANESPFALNVASYDRQSPAGTVAAWMRFPARVPESVVMAGFRSAIDGGQVGDGNELFLTLCALHSAGVRNVMISRWIVGGESTASALGEFVQELPFEGMHSSWSRSKALLRASDLDPTTEPMLTQAEHNIPALKGDQPFFWAGYIVAAPFGESELQAPGVSAK